MNTRLINIIDIILYKIGLRKQTVESLLIRMTKSHMPQSFIENRWLRSLMTSFWRQGKLRCLMRIDGIDTIFTLVLVENSPRVQGLDWKDIFIKIAPAIIVMTQFMNRCKIRCSGWHSKDIIKLKIREKGRNEGWTNMCDRQGLTITNCK